MAFHASSTPTDTYTLTASTDGNGTITPTNATVNAGDSQTFTITASQEYGELSGIRPGSRKGHVLPRPARDFRNGVRLP